MRCASIMMKIVVMALYTKRILNEEFLTLILYFWESKSTNPKIYWKNEFRRKKIKLKLEIPRRRRKIHRRKFAEYSLSIFDCKISSTHVRFSYHVNYRMVTNLLMTSTPLKNVQWFENFSILTVMTVFRWTLLRAHRNSVISGLFWASMT